MGFIYFTRFNPPPRTQPALAAVVGLVLAVGWVGVGWTAPPEPESKSAQSAGKDAVVPADITQAIVESRAAARQLARQRPPAAAAPHDGASPAVAPYALSKPKTKPRQAHGNPPRNQRGYLARRQPYLPLVNWQAAQVAQGGRVAGAEPAAHGTSQAGTGQGDGRGTTAVAASRRSAPDEEDLVPPPPTPPEELPTGAATPDAPDAPDASTETPPTDVAVPEPEVYDRIDLPAAWRLVLAANPTVGGAREALNEALALRQQANAIVLPNLNAGLMYHLHNGALQASNGQIRRLNEQSLYLGGGARTVAAESNTVPAIQFFHHLGDVIYLPLEARQFVVERRFNTTDTAHAILLEATLLYLDLVSAEARLDAVRQTEVETYGISRFCRGFANAGEGLGSDADRAHSDALLVHLDVLRAEERVAVASARLARVLNLEPSVRLQTAAGPLPALRIVDPAVPLNDLLNMALRRHPLLGSRSAAIDVAGTRLRQEQTRPFLPFLIAGYSAAGFGGTGNFISNPPFNNLANRTDFDVMAIWTLQNLGLGNVATIRQRRAEFSQSVENRARSLNQIRDEVAASYAEAQARMTKIRVTRLQLDEAENGFVRELKQLQAGAVLHPIEVLNMVELLALARQELIEAIIGYNRAQFRLFVATGLSPMRAGRSVVEPPPGIDVVGPRRTAAELLPPPPPPGDDLVPPAAP
ncbi:MAG TPA: TolC family protein [Pirellulales bacterium]|nr:TolC family protein [Pirellulales bacterium]